MLNRILRALRSFFMLKWELLEWELPKRSTWYRLIIILIILSAAIVSTLAGVLRNGDWPSLLINLGTGLGGSLLTYLLLESLIGRMLVRDESKARLVRELGSRDNADALKAAREIVDNGWHKDGALRNMILEHANLDYVELHQADLTKSMISGSSFRHAIFNYATFIGAVLHNTDFTCADFFSADLREVDFIGERWYRRGFFREHGVTNLAGARFNRVDLSNCQISMEQLASLESLEDATMPDGRKWEDWVKDKKIMKHIMSDGKTFRDWIRKRKREKPSAHEK
ncbi:MAG: hypothetical protein C0410_05605 [Anaerolinea sp.]|nr:hypothetical protein [Anaerolinea sp.]